MKIGPREQLILVIVGLVLVLVAVVALVVWPQYQKQQSLDAQIAAAEQQLNASRSLLSQRQEIKNRMAVTDAEWLRLASLVPENPDLPSLIIDLQDAAFASGVQLVGMTPGDPVSSADGTYVIIPIDLAVLGTWADTIEYLKGIEKLSRGLREYTFTVAIAPATTTRPLLPNYSEASSIKLEAYMIPASTGATSAPAPAPAPATP